MEATELKMTKRVQEHVAKLNEQIKVLQNSLETAKTELDRLSGRNEDLEKRASLDQLLFDISDKAKGAFVQVLEKEFSGYNSPLNKLAAASVAKYENRIRPIFDQAIENILVDADFTANLIEALRHKLAKIMLSKLEGEAEKRFNDWRADPERRAKLMLGIAELIKTIDNHTSSDDV